MADGKIFAHHKAQPKYYIRLYYVVGRSHLLDPRDGPIRGSESQSHTKGPRTGSACVHSTATGPT
eukprot:6213989-Pleurochrysis_carterae.AAC.3